MGLGYRVAIIVNKMFLYLFSKMHYKFDIFPSKVPCVNLKVAGKRKERRISYETSKLVIILVKIHFYLINNA